VTYQQFKVVSATKKQNRTELRAKSL